MSSSISSSDSSSDASPHPLAHPPAQAWAGLARHCLAWALGLLGFVYAFVCVVDPWGVLPLSPQLPRVPVSTNARFSFPALARSPAFDSVVIGTSTSRLLRPVVLNGEFGGHFANLAMNSATAWEQTRMLALFARTHARPRTVILGLDQGWCDPGLTKYTPRPFPEWMYGRNPWRGYREVATLYAVQEAASQFAIMTGLKRRRYGLDGYTSFLPPESAYDPARVADVFARWGVPDAAPAGPDAFAGPFPSHALLREALAALPPGTRALLFFAPSHIGQQGVPGSAAALRFAACKAGVVRAVAGLGVPAADFMRDSPITRDRSNYWDPLHYREPIADRLAADLALAAAGRANADFTLLGPGGLIPGK